MKRMLKKSWHWVNTIGKTEECTDSGKFLSDSVKGEATTKGRGVEYSSLPISSSLFPLIILNWHDGEYTPTEILKVNVKIWRSGDWFLENIFISYFAKTKITSCSIKSRMCYTVA